jgi:putative membrane protein
MTREAPGDVADATRRTRLANERTYLAWLRSALTALAVAVGAGKIVPSVSDVTPWPFEVLGAGFAVLAIVFVVAAAHRFVRVEAALDEGRFAPLRPATAIVLAAIAGVLSLTTLVLVFVH